MRDAWQRLAEGGFVSREWTRAGDVDGGATDESHERRSFGSSARSSAP